MTDPLTDEPAPVPEGSLFRAILALSESTDQVRDAVARQDRNRKSVIVLIGTVVVIVLAQFAFNSYILSKLSVVTHNTQNSVESVQSVTNPQSQAESRRLADQRTARIIYCNYSFVQNITAKKPIDPICPTTPPTSVPTAPAIPMQ